MSARPRSTMVALIASAAVDALGTGAFIPVSLLYFTKVASLSLPTVGALATTSVVVSLPVPLVTGYLADRFRPRNVVIAGQVLQCLGYLGFLVARSPLPVLAVLTLATVGQRVFWSSFFTLVAAVLLAVGQLAVTRLVRPLSRTLALGLAGGLWTLWALLTAAAGLVPDAVLVVYLVGVTMVYVGAELVHAPVSMALATEAAPEEARGTYLAVFQYSFAIATMVAPWMFTSLFTVDPRLPWLAVAVLAVLATASTPVLSRQLPAAAVHGKVTTPGK